jgi:hypothetical protein
MARNVGTWWIRDGLDDRRDEAQGFGSALANIPGFAWTQDLGDSNVLRQDFVNTANYTERIDLVDAMFMCSHGVYNDNDPSTWGLTFATSNGNVSVSDSIEWGQNDLEIFSSHACKLLYHSSSNEVWRWEPAFTRLHYMFSFHTVSYSGKGQRDRGKKFASNAVTHIIINNLLGVRIPAMTLREAWRKANIEVEDSSVKWAYLRAEGNNASGQFVGTYGETFESGEPGDPIQNRTFFYLNGSC